MRKEIEKCSVCGKVLCIDDEAYTDHDTGHILCPSHAYFDEEIGHYRKVKETIGSEIEVDKWICTDSSINQYGRLNADGTYDFKETIKWPDGSTTQKIAVDIDLNDYSEDEIWDSLDSFGYTKESILEFEKADQLWLKAECLFELHENL